MRGRAAAASVIDKKSKPKPLGNKVAGIKKKGDAKSLKSNSQLGDSREFEQSIDILDQSQNTLMPERSSTVIATLKAESVLDGPVRDMLNQDLTHADNVRAWEILEQIQADSLSQI